MSDTAVQVRLLTMHFVKPGMHTLIQDQGRSGHQHLGIPAGGVLDRKSAAAANWCVGNPPETPVLEITMLGPQIRFDQACQVAITGADLSPRLNNNPIDRYVTVDVPANATLSFGKLNSGCRAYLAVRGSWQLISWLGSASALSVGSTELVAGAVIKKGGDIHIMIPEPLPSLIKHPAPVIEWPEELTLRAFAGPEIQSFSAQQIAVFFNEPFTVSGDSNRIGYRLEPAFPDYAPVIDMISSGIVPGTVQITRQGQPVILLADAQTTGGYPRIANVLAEDLDAIAQLKPGNKVRFQIMKAL